jgi:hypothetical protein
VNLDWQASWMYELGVTRLFRQWLACERRLCFQPKLGAKHLLHAAGRRHGPEFFQSGHGFKGKRFDFDIAYQLGFAFDHNVSGAESPTSAITGATPDKPVMAFTASAAKPSSCRQASTFDS